MMPRRRFMVGEGAPEYAAEIPMYPGNRAGTKQQGTALAALHPDLNQQDWITWGQQTVLAAAAVDGGRPVESTQLLRARRKPPTTWTVQLVFDILVGEDPTETAGQDYVWTVTIGVGTAKVDIVRKFVVNHVPLVGYPQTVDQLIVPAEDIQSRFDWTPTVNAGVLKTRVTVMAAPRVL